MTRAALTKLLILVILAFIICLPEFFTLYRASKVNFLCLPYRPCERGILVKKEENGNSGGADIRRMDMCGPSRACTQDSQSNTTDPESESGGYGEDPEKSWFICETDQDMAELYSNTSSSALTAHVEVSVELQLTDAKTLNLTLYGRSNHSSLDLHPPEGEEEEEEEEKEDDEGQRMAFYCCFPTSPTSEGANQSRCLLWFANQTVLTATAKEKLPWKRPQKDEWQCVFRVLWLALLCVVLLTIITTVLGQIYQGRRICNKPMVHPVSYDFTGLPLQDGERQTEIIIPRGLSPIQEIDTQEEIETLLDENVDLSYTANLHHRGHPSASSVTEEQAW